MTDRSPFRVLASHFPGTTTIEQYQRVRALEITNCHKLREFNALKGQIADRLQNPPGDLEGVEAWNSHIRQKQRQESHAGESPPIPWHVLDGVHDSPVNSPNEKESETGDLKSVLGIDGISAGQEQEPKATRGVPPHPTEHDITLLELTEDSELIFEPFPRAIRGSGVTDTGSHFALRKREAFDPEDNGGGLPNYWCYEVDNSGRADAIYPFVWLCPRCGYIEHATPYAGIDKVVDPADDLRRLPCDQEECEGNLHLTSFNSPRDTEFKCYECGNIPEFTAHCPTCHIPDDEETVSDNGITSRMLPLPTDATLLSPLLIDNIIATETGGEIGYAALKDAAKREASDGRPYHWSLEGFGNRDGLPSINTKLIRERGFESIFTTETTESVFTIYGYHANPEHEHEQTDLDQQGRFVRTFHSDEYAGPVAYVLRSGGRAIIFKLNKEHVIEAIKDDRDFETYDEQVESELERFANDTQTQYPPRAFPVTGTLHALLHVIRTNARTVAGLEGVLSGKILIRDCAIVLIEREDLGSGGLAQLTLETRGDALVETIQKCEDTLTDCPADCDHGCPACTYIHEANCHPFVNEEVDQPLYGNEILHRAGAAEVLRRG